MDNEDNIIDAKVRFGKRRLDAIIIPTLPISDAEVIPIRPVRNAERLQEISDIFNEVIHPIVTLLEEHGFEREAMILSQNATEALWNGADRTQVKAQVEEELAEIDANLPSLLLDKPEDLDS